MSEVGQEVRVAELENLVAGEVTARNSDGTVMVKVGDSIHRAEAIVVYIRADKEVSDASQSDGQDSKD